MTPFEKIQAYSKAVCAQMRWKKAHAVITEEIENHLIDQRNAYMADGADEAAATDKAITQMGDPVTVGAQLDRTHRPKPQWGLMAIAIVFLVSGITFQFIMQWGSGYRWMVNLFIAEIIGLAYFPVYAFRISLGSDGIRKSLFRFSSCCFALVLFLYAPTYYPQMQMLCCSFFLRALRVWFIH